VLVEEPMEHLDGLVADWYVPPLPAFTFISALSNIMIGAS